MGRLAEISLPQPVDDCLQVLGKMLCGGRGCAPVQCCYWQPTNMLFGGADSGTDKVGHIQTLVARFLPLLKLAVLFRNDTA